MHSIEKLCVYSLVARDATFVNFNTSILFTWNIFKRPVKSWIPDISHVKTELC